MPRPQSHKSHSQIGGLIAGVWLLCPWLAGAQPMVFYLQNGDRWTGTSVAQDAEQVTILTLWTNRIQLPLSQIVRREPWADRPAATPLPQTEPSAALPSQAVNPAARKPTETQILPSAAALTPGQVERLADLTALYRADKITPHEYHTHRAQILLEAVLPGQAAAASDRAAPEPLAPPSSPSVAPSPRASPTVAQTGPPAPTLPLAEPLPPARSLRERLWLTRWHGDVQLGLNLSFGTLENQTLNGRLQAAYDRDQLRHSVDYNAAYGQREGVLAANRMEGSLKNELDLKKQRPLYIYHLGDYGYDEVRRINLSYQEGAGLGYHLWQRTNLVVNLESGGNYQGYRYANQSGIDYFSFRAGQNMTWQIWPKLLLTEKAQYLPEVGDFNNYKLRFEVMLTYPLWQHLTFNLSVIDLYDSQPAPEVSANDLQILSALGYTF